ncbi:MAG: hypothetical protein WCF85_12690 [Rhodospirillaceae bacterium]
MSAIAQPQSETNDLFNSIFHENAESLRLLYDGPRLKQYEWRLRILRKKQPNDVGVLVSLAAVLIMQGERDQAMPLLDAAWSLRSSATRPDYTALANVYIIVGNLDRARQLGQELIERFNIIDNSFTLRTLAALCFVVGDIPSLKKLSPLIAAINEFNAAEVYLSAINAYGLAPHIAEHQRLIHSAIQPAPCWYDLELYIDPEDGEWTICVKYAVRCDWEKAMNLEFKGTEVLMDYYKAQGIKPGPAAMFYNYMMVTIPPEESGRLES